MISARPSECLSRSPCRQASLAKLKLKIKEKIMKTQITKSKVLTICLLIVMAAPAAFAGPQCKTIFAVQHDRLVTEGCTSPIGFCAGGTFKGTQVFRGNFFFSALSFDPIPSDPLGRLVVPGVSTYTTDDGALTISDVSVFDTTRGTFAGVGRITEGTGSFAGATGDIFTTGRVSPDVLSFTTEMTGEICVPN
jgi:hypothetical protein